MGRVHMLLKEVALLSLEFWVSDCECRCCAMVCRLGAIGDGL